jgi:hypothetical protein
MKLEQNDKWTEEKKSNQNWTIHEWYDKGIIFYLTHACSKYTYCTHVLMN